MLVSVVAVGKPGPLAPAIREYEARAARYWKFAAVQVPAAQGKTAAEVLRREGQAIRGRLRPGLVRVAVVRSGRPWSSRELARWLGRLASGPEPGVHFLVGGAFGLEEELRRECRRQLSLSSLTLPRDLARLVLAEQLYRAGTLLRNEPYHKGVE